MVTFRTARAGDATAIRRLIYRVGINPIGLNWKRFLVAVDESDGVIGCGQIKPHGDATRELASIAVVPGRRREGIGSGLITRLVETQPLPLYLTCRAGLVDYYRKFGFCLARPDYLPPYFGRIWRLASILRRILPRFGELRVMVKE
jgi:N-acetylglutamate synthase-like GNAT family acetyltransferase